MAQPSSPSIPVAAATPAYGGNYTQAKQYAADATSPYGQQHPPKAATPVAQGQPAYYPPQAQTYYAGAQTVPGGAAYPPPQPGAFHVVQVPPQHPAGNDGCCVTPDWIFFGIGWVFGIFWIVGAFLPLCRTPKFANSTVKGGWIANCIGTVLLIVIIIIIIATAPSSSDDSGY